MTFRILHVDDDAVFLEFVQEVFAYEEEFEVVSRKHAKDALASVEDVQPDLVIVDILMPDMGGMELAQALRKMPATEQTPVFLVSAKARDLEKFSSLGDTASVVLSKPIEPDVLRLKVKAQLEKQ